MKKLFPLLILIVVLIVGILYFRWVKNPNKNTIAPTDFISPSAEITPTQIVDNRQLTNSAGVYAEYSQSEFSKAAEGRRVLFFYASWCPTCRPADMSFKSNTGKIPAGTTVIRVNYNDPETDAEEKALAAKYGVTYQHTFVQIDNNGQELTKWNGGRIDELLLNLK